jgi:hypothetical protein
MVIVMLVTVHRRICDPVIGDQSSYSVGTEGFGSSRGRAAIQIKVDILTETSLGRQ